MEASALWQTGHAATGQMVVTVHGVSCPLALSCGRSADWSSCLLPRCVELSALPRLPVLHGVTIVQQQWDGGDVLMVLKYQF